MRVLGEEVLIEALRGTKKRKSLAKDEASPGTDAKLQKKLDIAEREYAELQAHAALLVRLADHLRLPLSDPRRAEFP